MMRIFGRVIMTEEDFVAIVRGVSECERKATAFEIVNHFKEAVAAKPNDEDADPLEVARLACNAIEEASQTSQLYAPLIVEEFLTTGR